MFEAIKLWFIHYCLFFPHALTKSWLKRQAIWNHSTPVVNVQHLCIKSRGQQGKPWNPGSVRILALWQKYKLLHGEDVALKVQLVQSKRIQKYDCFPKTYL